MQGCVLPPPLQALHVVSLLKNRATINWAAPANLAFAVLYGGALAACLYWAHQSPTTYARRRELAVTLLPLAAFLAPCTWWVGVAVQAAEVAGVGEWVYGAREPAGHPCLLHLSISSTSIYFLSLPPACWAHLCRCLAPPLAQASQPARRRHPCCPTPDPHCSCLLLQGGLQERSLRRLPVAGRPIVGVPILLGGPLLRHHAPNARDHGPGMAQALRVERRGTGAVRGGGALAGAVHL